MRVAVPMNPDGRSFVFLREIRGSGTLGKACTGSIPGEGRRKDKRTGLFAPVPHRHREERRPGGPRSRQFPRRHLPALPGTDHGRDGEEVVWDWAGNPSSSHLRRTSGIRIAGGRVPQKRKTPPDFRSGGVGAYVSQFLLRSADQATVRRFLRVMEAISAEPMTPLTAADPGSGTAAAPPAKRNWAAPNPPLPGYEIWTLVMKSPPSA
jgi:hypothetical protein